MRINAFRTELEARLTTVPLRTDHFLAAGLIVARARRRTKRIKKTGRRERYPYASGPPGSTPPGVSGERIRTMAPRRIEIMPPQQGRRDCEFRFHK